MFYKAILLCMQNVIAVRICWGSCWALAGPTVCVSSSAIEGFF